MICQYNFIWENILQLLHKSSENGFMGGSWQQTNYPSEYIEGSTQIWVYSALPKLANDVTTKAIAATKYFTGTKLMWSVEIKNLSY